MERTKIWLLPFSIGLILLASAWLLSFPLHINSVSDIIFNNVSILYWVSLPFLLVSLYMIGISSNSNHVKWLVTIGIILTIYSLSFFYYMIPGADSQAFRGLTEYLSKTNDLDPAKPYHAYYQWPSYFLIKVISTSVSGIGLGNFEYLLFALIGVVYSTTIYVYSSRLFKNEGFLAVAAFFVSLFYFFNYQAVPFSLAFAFLLILFMLETKPKPKDWRITVLTVVLFAGMTLTHVFVPLFFVLYLLVRATLSKSKYYILLFLTALAIYVGWQLALSSPAAFFENIRRMTTVTGDVGGTANAIMAPVTSQIDAMAQMFSRGVTIATVIVCLVGFVLMLRRRKTRDLDKAILITGVVFAVLGIGSWYALGSRAIGIFFIPLSLGLVYILQTRLRKVVLSVFLVLLVLFVFIPVHSTSASNKVYYQTKEAYTAENFFIDHYNWDNPSLVLGHTSVLPYIETKQPSLVSFEDDAYSPNFPRIGAYDAIIYTTGLGINLLNHNFTVDMILEEENVNLVYNNGMSYLMTRSP